jgi:hypothetical protein
VNGRDIVAAPGPFNRPCECAECARIADLREHDSDANRPEVTFSNDVGFSFVALRSARGGSDALAGGPVSGMNWCPKVRCAE